MSRDPDSMPSILFLFPSLEDRGGVVTFAKTLQQQAGKVFSCKHFPIGNIVGNRSFLKRLHNFFRHYVRLKKTLREHDYDLIHLNPTFEIYSIIRDSFYLRVALKSGYAEKVVIFFHGWNPGLVSKIKSNFFLRRRFIHLYQQSGIIFVLSSAFKAQLIDLGIAAHKIKVSTTFYTPVDKNRISPKTEEKLNILFLSRMIKNKGTLAAAEVGTLLLSEGIKDFHITIAGDGPELEKLQHFIQARDLSDYIAAPGFVEGREKDELLQSCDIFLFPSLLNEGCPIVVLEAMGAGAAIISTAQGALPDIIEDSINGFIVPTGSSRDLFTAVHKLFKNRELLAKIQLENSRKSEREYTAVFVIEKILQEYRCLLAGYKT